MAEGKTIGALLIKIAADTAMLRAGIKQSQADIKGYEKSIGQLKSALVGAFSVGAIVAFGKASFQAYQQQMQQEKLLLTALKGRTDIQERLIRQANYLQGKTLFEDDAIIEQQKMLASMGMTEKQIREVIKASTELATALGTDLGGAVQMLTGTYSGNLRQLGKLIPELNNFTKEQLKAGEAVKWVNENMKGLAETAANTDPVKQMTKAWGEMQEQFGKMISPAVTNFATKGTKQFAVWGSEQLNFWQKASTLFGTKRLDKFYEVIQATNEEQQSQDDLEASTEKLTTAIDKQAKALKALSDAERKANLESMLKSVTTNGINNENFIGNFSSGWSPVSKKGKVGFVDKDGKLLKNQNPKSDVGGAALRAQWEENYQAMVEVFEKMKTTAQDMSLAIERTFENMAVGFGESIGKMIASGDQLDFTFIIKAFGDLAVTLGKLLIEFGIGGIALKNLIKNPYLSVAAGIGLVALGTAASSAASNVVSGGGSSGGYYSTSDVNSGSDYSYRKYGEGYGSLLRIEVTGQIRNDYIAISNKRGNNQLNQW